jgi:16S rRNA (guanine966-N2)-methyltransferase
MIRITGGALKGRLIRKVPDKRTRYTSSMVRQAIFNLVDVRGKKFLDLFCGSCLVLIEALSRGAVEGAGVDISSKAMAICKRNLKELKLYDKVRLYKSDAVRFVQSKGEKFDVIFMDPPYSLNISSKVLKSMREDLLSENGLIIVEESKKSQIFIPSFLEIIKEKNYGDTKLVVLKKK